MTSFGSYFFMAFLPVAKVLVTCAFGAFLGSSRMQMITPESRKHMNLLVFVAYTPALVFTRLAEAVTLENLIAWWYMPVNILLCYAIGSGLAYIVISVTEPPPHLRKLIVACCAAGNIGNVPLVLVPSICLEVGNPFGAKETCSVNAVAYVSFGLWMGMVLTWTWIYNLLKPEMPKTIETEKSGTIMSSSGSSAVSPHSSDFGEFQSHELQDVDFKNQHDYSMNNNNNWSGSPSSLPRHQVSSDSLVSPSAASLSTVMSNPRPFFKSVVEKYGLKKVFTPPTTAALVGLIVGLVPGFRYIMLGPLKAFTDSTDIIGQAMIPVMNLVLGASLVQGSQVSELKMKTIIGIILVRLFALPILGMILIKIVHDLGLLPPDPLFRFVLMLQYTMPTAMNVGTVAQLHGVGEKEVALVLFWSYISASVFITFWVLVYLEYTFAD